MKIKTPLVIDLSHWEKVPDFLKIDPQPVVVIMKATEGNTIVDGSFADFWGRTSGKYCRMAYHFFRIDKPIAEQAELFVKTVTNAGLHAKDVLILVIEEEKTPASKIVEWLSYVDTKVSNEILIYSRKNILEPIVRTPEQVEFLKKYKIWTAGYPFTPDNFSSVPASYVPNPDQWGKTVLWQYSESAKLPGIEGAVDVNWIDPEYAEGGDVLQGRLHLDRHHRPARCRPGFGRRLYNGWRILGGCTRLNGILTCHSTIKESLSSEWVRGYFGQDLDPDSPPGDAEGARPRPPTGPTGSQGRCSRSGAPHAPATG